MFDCKLAYLMVNLIVGAADPALIPSSVTLLLLSGSITIQRKHENILLKYFKTVLILVFY